MAKKNMKKAKAGKTTKKAAEGEEPKIKTPEEIAAEQANVKKGKLKIGIFFNGKGYKAGSDVPEGYVKRLKEKNIDPSTIIKD